MIITDLKRIQQFAKNAGNISRASENLDWLVGCFGLNGPLRQYFSLYRAVPQREGERKMIDERKMSTQPQLASTERAIGISILFYSIP